MVISISLQCQGQFGECQRNSRKHNKNLWLHPDKCLGLNPTVTNFYNNPVNMTSMLKLKKFSGLLLVALCLVFLSNAPAYSQSSSCDGTTGSCVNECGDYCGTPSYGSGSCTTGVICCYNPQQPGAGSYWSNNGCSTLLAPDAYVSADCGYCTCCYDPNNHRDSCETFQ